MDELNELLAKRHPTTEQVENAKSIVMEINDAWAFPENSELGKYQQEGYQASIGNPHDWWEANCVSYRELSQKYQRSRDFNTVCLLANAMLNTN